MADRTSKWGGFALVSLVLLATIASANDGNQSQSILERLGLTPSPAVCSGCEAEQQTYNVAIATMLASIDAAEAAEQALIACQQGQGSGGGPSLSHTESGESILVATEADFGE
ncbi:MAG: hypothetical protein AAFU85_05680 [Planctomycetota bacterium]